MTEFVISEGRHSTLALAKRVLAAQMREDIKAGHLDELRIAKLMGEGPGAAVVGQAVLTPITSELLLSLDASAN